jgi:hypothetical protein
MSNEQKPADELDDAWGSSDSGGFGAHDDGGHFSSAINQSPEPDPQQVVDVEDAAPSKKSNSKMGLIIAAVIGVAAIGFAGFAGHTLYSKLVPAKQQSQNSIQFDRQNDVGGGMPAAQGQMPGGAAMMPGGGDAGSTPTANQPSTGDVTPGPVAAASPVDSASSSQVAPRQEASAVAVSAGSVPPANSVNPSAANHGAAQPLQQPQVAQPGINKPAAAQAEQQVICPVVESKPVVAEKRKQEPRVRKAQSSAAADASVRREQRKQVSARKSAVSDKKNDADAATAVSGFTPAEAALTQKASGGSLDGYRLMSIWPKTGDHQQATVKDASGANHVLRAGDVIAGSRVRAVNALKYEVETDAGFIR